MNFNQTLYGYRPQEVIRALELRREAKSLPGKRKDDLRLVLVVEGGGMRGLISATALEAVWKLGMGDCFDEIRGTSAGAMNGAYFLADQIREAASIYYRRLIGNSFISFRRWPDIMNLHYLFDDWVEGGTKMDVKKVVDSPVDFHISATDTESGMTRFFQNHSLAPGELVPVLRASTATPMFTTHAESIDGRMYNDGALQAGIPLPPEPDQERTRILCLLTRPRGYRKKQAKWIKPYELLRLRRFSSEYRRAYFERIVCYNRSVDRVYHACVGPPILAIAPEPGDFMIGNGETDAARLERAAAESYHRTTRILGGELSPWQPYAPEI